MLLSTSNRVPPQTDSGVAEHKMDGTDVCRIHYCHRTPPSLETRLTNPTNQTCVPLHDACMHTAITAMEIVIILHLSEEVPARTSDRRDGGFIPSRRAGRCGGTGSPVRRTSAGGGPRCWPTAGQHTELCHGNEADGNPGPIVRPESAANQGTQRGPARHRRPAAAEGGTAWAPGVRRTAGAPH